MTAGWLTPIRCVNPSPISWVRSWRPKTGGETIFFTGDSRYLAQFLAGLDRIPPVTRKIIELTADDPDQQKRIAKLNALTEQSLSIWAATADAARAAQQDGGPIPPLAREIELRSCVAELTALLDKDE